MFIKSIFNRIKQRIAYYIVKRSTNKVLNFYKNKKFDQIYKICNYGILYNIKNNYPHIYVDLFEHINKNNIEIINKKVKIRIAFVVYSSTMWSCGKLYDLFKNDERFEVYIILAHYKNDLNNNKSQIFNSSYNFFKENNYNIICISHDAHRNQVEKEYFNPDILIYLTPYDAFIPSWINLTKVTVEKIIIYIAYSYMLSDTPEKYDLPGMNIVWKHYCDSEYYKELLIKHDNLKKLNTFFMGYPKMDYMFDEKKYNKREIWKINNNIDKVKCIIYTPHHSLPNCETMSKFSTFDKNYKMIYNLAKDYCNDTSWIIKPHPNLRKMSVLSGLFRNVEEYDSYLEMWNSLPNAKVVTEGTYYNIFLTSDLMIGDSVSFLAEYQFTGKPLIFLMRDKIQFNEFGKNLLEVNYKVMGDDFISIENIFKEIIFNNNDYMMNERINFFNKYLNYHIDKNDSASNRIYKDIVSSIF